MIFDRDTIQFDGCRVLVEYHFDEAADPPWENSDCHGPVRRGSRHLNGSSDKRPGERPLNCASRHEAQYYYDWAAACRLARQDAWNAEPYDAPDKVERAVLADFKFLQGWINDDWSYVGVVVTIVDQDDDPIKPRGERLTESLWCIESLNGYHRTQAREMADELAKAYLEMLGEAEETHA